MDNPLYSLFDMISSDNYPKPPGQEKYETWDMRDSESNQGILRLLHNIINPVGEISEDNTFTPTDPAALLSAGGILDLLGRKVGKSAKLVKKLTGPSANTNIKNIPIKNMSPDSQDIPIWSVHNTPSPTQQAREAAVQAADRAQRRGADLRSNWPPSLSWNKKTKDMEDKGFLWAQDKMSSKDFKKYLKGQGYDVDLRQRDSGYLEIYDRISGNPYKLDL